MSASVHSQVDTQQSASLAATPRRDSPQGKCCVAGRDGSRFRLSSSHLPAGVGTRTAGGDALLHLANTLAILGALCADFSAFATRVPVMRCVDQHEIRRRATNFGAGDHQFKMLGLDMLATHLQAMIECHVRAGFIAGKAGFDAARHVFGLHAISLSGWSRFSFHRCHRRNWHRPCRCDDISSFSFCKVIDKSTERPCAIVKAKIADAQRIAQGHFLKRLSRQAPYFFMPSFFMSSFFIILSFFMPFFIESGRSTAVPVLVVPG